MRVNYVHLAMPRRDVEPVVFARRVDHVAGLIDRVAAFPEAAELPVAEEPHLADDPAATVLAPRVSAASRALGTRGIITTHADDVPELITIIATAQTKSAIATI